MLRKRVRISETKIATESNGLVLEIEFQLNFGGLSSGSFIGRGRECLSRMRREDALYTLHNLDRTEQ